MRIEIGSEIRFFRWNSGSSEHDVFRALVRSITGNKFEHPTVALSYFDSSPTNQAIVRNEEFYATTADLAGEDYWKHAFRIHFPWQSRPFDCLNPQIGNAVWYFRYDATDNEHYAHKAIVRTKGVAPRPSIGLFWVPGEDQRQNESGIEPWTDQTFPTSNDYWAKRTLFPA